MQFQKGQSGNPAGRPRGSRNKTTVLMQNLLEGEAEAIARKAIEMAKDGDMTAIRVCMDRLASVRRKDPIAFELPPVGKARDAAAAVAAVISALAAGDLTTGEAAEAAKLHRRLRAHALGDRFRGAAGAARTGKACTSAVRARVRSSHDGCRWVTAPQKAGRESGLAFSASPSRSRIFRLPPN